MSNNPINRLNFFFDQQELDFQLSIGKEYLDTFLNTYINLYRVDKSKIEVDIYGEADAEDIILYSPVKIPCIINLAESDNKAYNDNNTLRFKEYGNLTAGIFMDTLTELGVEITYGDYIGYQVDEELEVLFQVFDDDLKNFENSKTFGGYKAYYRTIMAAPVDRGEIKFKIE